MTFTVQAIHCGNRYVYDVTTKDWASFECIKQPSNFYDDFTIPPKQFTLKKGETYTDDHFREIKLQLMEEIGHFYLRYRKMLK